METQSTNPGTQKAILMQWLLGVALLLCSIDGFSQRANQPNQQLTSLENVVEDIKAKNESIKDAEQVNVMVNDLLILDLKDFKIDPKSIAMVEVLDLNPKAGSSKRIKSIIINTRK